jgi:hypothetical protein
MSSNSRRSTYSTDEAFEFVLVTDKLLQFAVALRIYHICGRWVANLIRIIGLVGFDIPRLPHVLHLLLRPQIHRQAFYF